jgi:hypothetical protein
MFLPGPNAGLRRTLEQLRTIREELERRVLRERERRRAEDRIREERHDERAKTISGKTLRKP